MGKYKLVVLSSPVDGREDEFNDWYTNRHLGDVVAVPGFVSAERFKLKSVGAGEFSTNYLAIYEMDADDPDAALNALMARADAGEMFISEALNENTTLCGVFEVVSQKVLAPATKAKA